MNLVGATKPICVYLGGNYDSYTNSYSPINDNEVVECLSYLYSQQNFAQRDIQNIQDTRTDDAVLSIISLIAVVVALTLFIIVEVQLAKLKKLVKKGKE